MYAQGVAEVFGLFYLLIYIRLSGVLAFWRSGGPALRLFDVSVVSQSGRLSEPTASRLLGDWTIQPTQGAE